MSLISFEKVTLGYEGQPVVKDLTFEVNKGDYLCVLGQNGSGKSTMMKALLGFLAPMSGRITRDPKLKNAIGYLPQQEPAQSDFPASVYEVVLSGCQNRKGFFPFYNKADRALCEEKMALLGIADIAGRSFKDLSGGQKQRALLARALCAAGDLLLLDEPAAALDPVAAEELYVLVRALHKKGMTVIMISHDPERAIRDATHILHLGQEMLYFGPTADYDRPAILKRERGEIT
ncbi:MAG: metal ABC transporter ATP-binding protein [Clostridia bacterium]|nr:metal ABC transporter ATP-binding protein [Clostridia bacterium]